MQLQSLKTLGQIFQIFTIKIQSCLMVLTFFFSIKNLLNIVTSQTYSGLIFSYKYFTINICTVCVM